MSIGKRPTQYMGVLPKNPPNVIFASRNPVNGQDIAYNPGDIWLNSSGSTAYIFAATGGLWIAIGTGASGGIVTVAGTANQITASTVGTTATLSIPSTFIAPGSIAATTTITAGTNITLTNGNLIMSGAGKMIQMNGGAATDFIGTGTLAAGTVTIANTNITAADRIMISRRSVNSSTALGDYTYAITPSTGFTVTSVQRADPSATETNDVSIFDYVIVREL